MSTASSNLAQIALIKETVFGQVPVAGNPQLMRFTGESFKFSITTETSQEIRSDRQITDLIQTDAEAGGDLNYEFSFETYDDLIASALANDWSGNVLTNGTKLYTYSVEQGFLDIGQYIVHSGMGVNTMSLDFSIGSIVTGSFGFMGASSERDTTTQLPGTPVAQTSTPVMDAASGFADLMVNGVAYPCGISRINLTTTNNMRAQKALGKLGACSMALGTFNVTGEISVYFSDGLMYDRFIKNEDVALSWRAFDSLNNEYQFEIPRLRFSDGTVNAGGMDQDVELSLPFQALLAPAGYTLKITRAVGSTLAPPVNTLLPTITGVAQVGEVLTATPGTWTGSPTPTLSYQWLRDGAIIPGATGTTYTLQAADETAEITVREVATNSKGTVAVVSVEVGPVTA